MALVQLNKAIEEPVQTISERVAAGGVDVVGLPTGFGQLDKVLGGLRKKELYILGGRPGMGKTSLALAMAMNVAFEKKVLFLSLEMDASLLSVRVLSGQTGIPAERIERGRLSKDEMLQVQGVIKQTQHLQFGVLDDRMESDQFVEYAQEFAEKKSCDLIVVDYLSLLRDPNRFGDNERVARIVGNLRSVAYAADVPVLGLVQLNREVEKRENHVPTLSDIRDSGAIEQDAFCVMFTYRPYYYEMMLDGAPPVEVEKDAKIIVSKNRQGETGHVTVDFYPARMMWAPKDGGPPKPPPSTNVGDGTFRAGNLVSKVKEKQ